MSYRSIKRVLGETSLERKCRFLFGACLLLLITASFSFYGAQTKKLVDEQNRKTGRLLVDQVMLIEHMREFETNDQFREVVYDLTKILSKHEFKGYVIKPEYNQYVITQVTTGGDAEDPEKLDLDAKELILLEKLLEAGPKLPGESDESEFRELTVSEKDEYRYYQPIRADQSCIAVCHRQLPGGDVSEAGPAFGGAGPTPGVPLSEGDLMAVVKVTIPYGPIEEQLNWNAVILLSTAIVTVFLAMVASYVIVRYVIVKPLRHLREVSDAISHGNTALRAEIHTGDEFESLAVAFNRMLRHLVDAQEELRQVNANLDAKVDELAQVNMRLYEMNTIKSDFLATMSHELRTPLNSILGFSEVLGSIDSLQDKQKRYVQNIQTSGRMLLEMINDILDLAKMESGKMETRLTDFRPEQVIAVQCDMARPLTEKKNIDLEARYESNLPPMHQDPMHQDQARMQQILNNLLSNAVKFTPEGGRITVIAERDAEDCLVLKVADTGVGIAEEDQQTIFEKFRQVRPRRQGEHDAPGGPTTREDAMTREYSGTGLGLSIVKELCKLLGGEISVESELGKGSTFTVRLPWSLQEQPRLDSALVEGFEEFTKPRYDLLRDPSAKAALPAPQTTD